MRPTWQGRMRPCPNRELGDGDCLALLCVPVLDRQGVATTGKRAQRSEQQLRLAVGGGQREALYVQVPAAVERDREFAATSGEFEWVGTRLGFAVLQRRSVLGRRAGAEDQLDLARRPALPGRALRAG
jgi:hypothetical protein